MAEIKIRLEVNPNAETEKIKSISNDNLIAKPSNTSFKVNSKGIYDVVYSTPPKYAFNGIRGLSWAENTIIENGQEIKENGLLITADEYVSNYDGLSGTLTSEQNPIEFVWGIVPKTKKYSVKLTITGEENNLKDLVFYGDRNADQYPTRAIIDGDTDNPIYSDDYKWVINLLEEKQTHTIEFTDWNRANYNAVLVLMRVTLRYYDIDKFSGLDSFETQLQSNSQPKEIFYGCVPNSNSADISAEENLIDMVVDELIPNSNLPIEIYENGNKIANHITTESDLTTEKVLNFQSSDHLSLFDQIQFKGRPYSQKAYSTDLPTLYDIATYVFEQTLGMTRNDTDSTKDDFAYMFGDTIIVRQNSVMTIKEYLKGIKIPYDYLEPDNLRATIDKICTIAQLNFIETAENIYPKNLKFVTARPIRPNTDENVLLLPLSMCLEAPQKDIIVKNKYDGVEISEIVVKDEIDYGALVETKEFLSSPAPPHSIESDGNNHREVIQTIIWVGYTYLELTYYNITVTVSPEYAYNLKKNIKLYNGEKKDGTAWIDYNVDYSYQTGNATLKNSSSGYPFNETMFDYNLGDKIDGTGKISEKDIITISNPFAPKVMKTSIDNNTNNKTAEFDSSNTIRLQILVKLKSLTYCSEKDMYEFPLNEKYRKTEEYTPKKLTINFYGEVREITFSDKSFVGTSGNDYISITENTILQSGTNFQNAKISTIIQENILSDYKDGIATATFNCLNKDIKGVDGTVKRKWENGETFKIGDIVKPIDDRGTETKPLYTYKDGSPMYFKVTGITHKYDGVPLQDLELQEVKTPKE